MKKQVFRLFLNARDPIYISRNLKIKMANSFSDDGATGQDGVDAMFVILAAFIIFTMQSGFGLLESGKFLIQYGKSFIINKTSNYHMSLTLK